MKTPCVLALVIAALQPLGCSMQRTSPKQQAAGISQPVAAATPSLAGRRIQERCKVHGSDDVVTYFTDGSVEVASGGKTIRGAYRPG